jgi:hypothetical protein
MWVALLNALVAGAGVAFVYKAAERVYGVDAGDGAAALYVTTPSLILYGSTVDAVLCALGAAVVYLLALYFSRGRFAYAALTGIAIAAGTFVAYQFGFIWVLLALWSLLYVLRRRKGERGDEPAAAGRVLSAGRLAALGATAAATFGLFFVGVYAFSGFNVLTEFQYQQRASERYFGAGGNVVYWAKRLFFNAPAYPTKHRSYLMWMPGNVVAFFTLLGPPTTVLFLRNLWKELKEKKAGRLALISAAAALSFALVNLLGFTLAETERVWLFMVPWFLVGAGYYLKKGAGRFFYPALLFNLALAFLFVIFFYHVK